MLIYIHGNVSVPESNTLNIHFNIMYNQSINTKPANSPKKKSCCSGHVERTRCQTIPMTAVPYHILSIWSSMMIISAIFSQLRISNTFHGAHFEAVILLCTIAVSIVINNYHLYRYNLFLYVLRSKFCAFPLCKKVVS